MAGIVTGGLRKIEGHLGPGQIFPNGTSAATRAPMDDMAWSAGANLEQPCVVQRVHEDYIRADAEMIIANTFAAMHAEPELTLDAIKIIRRHFAGPIGVYVETGGQASPGAAG